MIGGRVYHCMERVQLHRDWLEAELSKEVENGRLFRLLAKLGTVTERPEYVSVCSQLDFLLSHLLPGLMVILSGVRLETATC